VDHSYARTSYKEQGATNHREIVAISQTGAKVFNREAAYVAVSRAKDNTEIVTSDINMMKKNAGKDVTKSVAHEEKNLVAVLNERNAQVKEDKLDQAVVKQQGIGRSLSF
jgi:ATP-dependent exoDNAse (exonuclease V) alpha subunit